MACNSIEQITTEFCNSNNGGVIRVLVIDQDDIQSITVNEPHWTIDDITFDVPFVELYFRKNVSTFTTDEATDLLNGSQYYINNGTILFHKRKADTSKALNILAEGQRYLAFVVEDNNGKFWYYPYMQLNGGQETTGVSKIEGSKYETIFIGEDNNRPYEVNPDIIAGLLVADTYFIVDEFGNILVDENGDGIIWI